MICIGKICLKIVMASGSKSRVWVGVRYHFLGSGTKKVGFSSSLVGFPTTSLFIGLASKHWILVTFLGFGSGSGIRKVAFFTPGFGFSGRYLNPSLP